MEGKHVFYVWFDALIAYMSAVDGRSLWPADLHLIGKEILRFHAVFWPAFLMAADVPLPKRIFAHGWLLFENDKMSKSRGNIVRAEPIRQVMGADALRYFLLREMVFGQDGSFSYDALVGRYNSDLANGLGNLASRTLTMIHQYRERRDSRRRSTRSIAALAERDHPGRRSGLRRASNSRKGLEAIWALISAVDKFIVEQAPWKLARKPDRSRSSNSMTLSTPPPKRCASSPRCCRRCCRESAPKIWAQLGMTEPLESVRFETLALGPAAGRARRSAKSPAVFPRIELKDAVEKMRELEDEVTARAAGPAGQEAGARGSDALRRAGQDRHRRFRQGGSARRPGALRRAREGLRQAAAPEGRYRRSRSRAPSWPASPKPTQPEQLSTAKW